VIENFEITIYDRWGMIVYYSENISEGWDGTINDKPQQQDVFVYKIRYTKIHTQQNLEMVGTVNLVR
jgi:gliding motility-associated-like protein